MIDAAITAGGRHGSPRLAPASMRAPADGSKPPVTFDGSQYDAMIDREEAVGTVDAGVS